MRATLGRIGGLVALWLVLARSVSLGQVVAGIVVATVAILVVPPVEGRTMRVARLPRLLVRQARAVLVATLAVARTTLSPGAPPPGLLDVHLPDARPTELSWVSVLVTLTPGTFVVHQDAATSRLRVHVLDIRDRDQVADDLVRLDAEVRALFGLDPTTPVASVPEEAIP